MKRSLSRVVVLVAVSLLSASCSGGGGSTTASGGRSSQPSSAPHIVSLSPPSVPPGSDAFTLTVNGANFPSNAVIMFEQTQRPTTFVNSTQLTTPVSKDEVAQGHNIGVNVIVPNVTAANGVTFKVEFPQPTITSLSKTAAQVNDPGFTLTVTGSNFFKGAHVQWDGLDRVTQFVSSTQLTAQILTGDIAVGGNHTIRVSNPSPNAGISDGVNFFVQAPKPAITSITPDTVYAAGDPNKNRFTITGTNFIATSQVYFDGQLLSSAYVTKTPTQLTFYGPAIPRRLGPLEIKVSNDGGGPQTDTTSITLIASAAGINTSPMFGPLLTDDLTENVYLLQRIAPGAPVYAHRVAIYETCIGVPSCTPQSHTLEDLGTPSSAITFHSYIPTDISADARYITYLPEEIATSGHYIYYGPQYVFDTCKGATAGCAPASYRITVPADGTAPNDNQGENCGLQIGGCQPQGESVSISGDGRYVAFQTDLDNMVTGDTNGAFDVFLRDMCLGAPAGCLPTTVRIAEAAFAPRMSRDARFIYYLASGGLHVYDTCIGAPSGCVSSDVIEDIGDTGTPLGRPDTYNISHNGRYVAFGVYPSFGTRKTWLRDTCLGVTTVCTPTTVLLITTEPVQSLTEDGKFVAVTTKEPFGDPADTNDTDVYVIKTCLGASGSCTQVAKRISVDAQGIQVGGQDATFTPDGMRIIYSQFGVGTVITEPLTLP